MSEKLSTQEQIKQLEDQLKSANEEIERLTKALEKKQEENRILEKRNLAANNRISQLSVMLVEKQERIELLEIHALEDPLTGLYNVRYIDQQATRLEKAVSTRVLCVTVIDINFLKRINDNFGHDIGNQVLAAFAKKLREFPGESKTVARIGGDEFIIIKAKDTEQQARAYGEMVRNTLNKGFELSIAGTTINCKASVGFSTNPLDGKFSFKDLCILADEEMYENKRRNK